jgi:hypothetical protein
MSTLRFGWLLVLLWGVGGLRAAHATHILGGDIAYALVASTAAGVPRYHITVRLFRDVSSSVAQDQVDLTCNRSGCNATATDYFTVTVHRNLSVQLTAIGCSLTTPIRTYDTILFETDVDLPRGQWTLSVHAENRAADIQNMSNSVNQAFYISAFLNNALVAQNNSPRFLSNLLPYLCGNSAQRYSFSTFDIDGDSLAYSFAIPQSAVQPLSLCGTDVVGFMPGQFQLNTATGALTAPAGPVRQGFYAMAARVSEYRRINGTWQAIGYVTRDITYLAYSATNIAPQFTGFTLANGATQAPNQVIPVQAGQTVSLALSAADADAGQALRFSSDATSVVPGLSLTTLGATQARLTWQVPATLPPGRYTATVAVFDNGCPLNASEEQTFSFLVSARTLASHPALPPATGAAFPMPFREQVQFQAAASSQAVTIVDELGRVVALLQAGADGRVQWQPTPTLPAGLYVARGADGRPLARLLRAGN